MVDCRNLAYNNFTGPLPATLASNRKIKLTITGNNIHEDNPSPPSTDAGRNIKRLMPNHAFTYEEILKITHNFETHIGEGGSGSVYYGLLNNGNEVAVKVLKDWRQRGSKEFIAEVKLLVTVHHKNLVSFVGYCDEGMNMIVLYEYMHNGSLRDLLSGINKAIMNLELYSIDQETIRKTCHRICCKNMPEIILLLVGKKATTEPLTWKRRLQIALDVAAGLEYLHSGCKPAIIHRDVKTTNILLNEQLEAKLADFGISRVDEKTQTSTVIAGTPGYIDPDYSETSILTKKSDVYSFGVVLFELICGHPVRFGTPEQYFYIVQWATLNIMSGQIDSIIDPRIKGAHKMNSVWKVAEVAIACTARSSAERPHMYNILNDLKQAMEIEMEADSQELEVSAIEVVTTSESSTEASRLVSDSPRTPIRRSEA
ncbi:putative LRR receptor-like serine/threonine-protein kinase [Nymphaea thermarum]|nr:putative LRR receptor-like serine/threonine-protein kinase [Nymphaea thermarum]